MTYSASDRWGATELNPPIERLRELLQSLDIEEKEHPDVALKHETEWCLSAYRSGLLVWENVEAEHSSAKHMKCVPREAVLGLWLKLARGDIAAIQAEPWLPGYG
jgi:hypothetical protein